ncbi:protein of unknown function [Lachnospiraceae bacterium G41]|nr:protein of unknown function [Lachnospiraceae bacterium G41]
MKKNELISKLSLIGAMILVASTLVACDSGTNYATTTATADDYSYAQGKNAFYETATTGGYDLYDDVDYYPEEAEYYDEGGYSVGNMSTPITETQANASVAKNRKLIKTVDMTIETVSFDETIANLRNKINAIGGYIESEYSYNGSLYNNSSQSKYATITVRVPDTELDGFVNDVSGIGNVTQKTTSTRDVTLNYVDTESKKEMYKAEQESLLALLEKAETIEDITYLTQRLTEVRYNIESMESSLRVYDDLVDYATVNFTINEVKVLTPTVIVEKTPGEELKEGFATSIKDVLVDTRDFFIRLIINLPYIIRGLICLAIPVVIIFIIVLIIVKVCTKKSKPSKKTMDNVKAANEKLTTVAAKVEAEKKAPAQTEVKKEENK